MTKKPTILLLCLFFSCSNINTIKTDVSNKTTTSTSSQLIMESKTPLSNLDGLLKLKAEFKSNESSLFTDGYFDDNNNGLIFLSDKAYYINSKSDIVRSDFDYKIGALTNPILDENGNGFSLHEPTITDAMVPSSYTFKRFEKFLPKESIKVPNYLPDLMKYRSPKFIDNIGVYYGNNIFYKFTLDNYNYPHILDRIELDQSIQIYNKIFDKNNNGFIVTREKENNKIINKLYLYKNNELDLKSPQTIDFNSVDNELYINGQINENGNGYIYSIVNNTDIKLKRVLNYSVLDELIVFDNIDPNFEFNIVLEANTLKLDSEGNGFIISKQADSKLFLHEIKNYKKTGNKYLLASNLDKTVRYPMYSINSSGNGFILITTSKNITIPVTFPVNYDNEMIIIKNYKAVEE